MTVEGIPESERLLRCSRLPLVPLVFEPPVTILSPLVSVSVR